MSIEYRTVDGFGRIFPVSNLRDHFDKPTEEPLLAERCIVHAGADLIAMTTDECPIYTVH